MLNTLGGHSGDHSGESDKQREVESLRRLATAYRNAIEQAIPYFDRTLTPSMCSFPLRCCDHASKLLLLYFHSNEIRDLEWVCSDLFQNELAEDARHRHVWLERAGIVIDITADQFGGGLSPVIVSRSSVWHLNQTMKKKGWPANHDEESFAKAARENPYFQLLLPQIERFLG